MLHELNIEQLMAIAKTLNIRNFRRFSRSELIEFIEEVREKEFNNNLHFISLSSGESNHNNEYYSGLL